MKFDRKVFLFLFFIICLGYFGFKTKIAEASSTDAPIIIEASIKRTSATANYIYVTGLTASGTEILIYVDGVFFDIAKINNEGTGTDNFYYRSESSLEEGEHSIMMLARNKKTMVLSVPVQKNIVVSLLPAPTLIKPNENNVIGKPKPFIAGLSVSETLVHIYIDGVYNGKTEILVHKSGTASFAYLPFLNLEKGEHKVWAVAEDENGKKSRSSNTLIFKIEDPMPAPTMFEPVVNSATIQSKPFIVGLAKNNSLIKVYIDEKIDGQFLVKNHESGTANFAYKPARFLTNGKHIIYTTAVDSRGKESIWSNIIDFQVFQNIEKKIEKKEKKEENNVEILGEKIDDETILNQLEENDEEVEASKNEVKVDSKKFETKPELIIFIAFVVGIIIWIIWVNRELVKEKETQEKQNKDEKEKKDSN